MDARNALRSAQDKLSDIERDIRDRKEDLEDENYGPGGVFRQLKGRCFIKDTGEYEYEHCFLDRTRQISKKGGMSVGLGQFQRVGQVDVDEVDESTGRIVKAQRTTLEYDRGQKCWNGPQRSTRVRLECGGKDEVVQVREDEMCVYSMVATTPAVCEEDDGEASKEDGSRKDEL